MNFSSLGDAMQQFHLQRHNTVLKTSLNTLASELSSGETSDRVKALGGDTARFSMIDNRLKVLTSQQNLTSETGLTLSTAQSILSNFDTQRNALSEPLLLISAESPDFQIAEASRAARDKFDGLVSTINTRFGSDSLFSGTAVDQPSLSPASDMIADIVAEIGGATDFGAISTAINIWFDDPAGGFATLGYTGDTGDKVERRLDSGTVVTFDARADDPGIKAVLKGAAFAAITFELAGVNQTTKSELLIEGGVQLQSSASGMAQLQGQIGYVEGEVERISVSQNAEQSALNIARNLMTQADPFETATELQAVQTQLETHYAMTARLSQLSLAEYLR